MEKVGKRTKGDNNYGLLPLRIESQRKSSTIELRPDILHLLQGSLVFPKDNEAKRVRRTNLVRTLPTFMSLLLL